MADPETLAHHIAELAHALDCVPELLELLKGDRARDPEDDRMLMLVRRDVMSLHRRALVKENRREARPLSRAEIRKMAPGNIKWDRLPSRLVNPRIPMGLRLERSPAEAENDELSDGGAAALLQLALHLSAGGHDGALAVAVVLGMGLVPDSFIYRAVKSVDLRNRRLRLDEIKRQRGITRRAIPAFLLPHFRQRVETRERHHPLFISASENGLASSPTFTGNHARSMCKALGIGNATVWGLIGTHRRIKAEHGDDFFAGVLARLS